MPEEEFVSLFKKDEACKDLYRPYISSHNGDTYVIIGKVPPREEKYEGMFIFENKMLVQYKKREYDKLPIFPVVRDYTFLLPGYPKQPKQEKFTPTP